MPSTSSFRSVTRGSSPLNAYAFFPISRILDVIYAVRADESTHRFVNHSLASLEVSDTNPFALGEPGMKVKGAKPG